DKNAFRFGDQFHLGGVDRDIAGAQSLVHGQVADIQLEFAGDLSGQAFDFDFAGHDFENAAFHLHARGFAEGVNRNLDAHANVHRNAQEVHVEKISGHRIDLPILDDG